MGGVEVQETPDIERHGARTGSVRSVLLILLLGGIASVIVSYVVWFYYQDSQFERIAAFFLSATFIIAALKISLDWHRSESMSSLLDETNPTHEKFRNWIIRVLLIAILLVTSTILILYSVGLSRDLLIISAEIGVLVITIAFIVLCSKYNATSFTVDVKELIREFRTSNESMTSIYQKAATDLTGTFDRNTSQLLQKLDEHGERQATSLRDLAAAVRVMADALVEQKALQEETKRIAKETLEEQKRMAEQRADLEGMREQQRIEREEQERLRIMPRLGLRMYDTGTVFHKVHLQVVNGGMSGENLEVAIQGQGVTPARRMLGNIVGQGRKQWELGDVKMFPHTAQFQISAVIADSMGRKYRYEATFGYERRVGWLDVTQSIRISPRQFVWPEPQPVGEDI